MNEKELERLIIRYNKLADKVNLAIKKKNCIERINEASYQKHLAWRELEDITDEMRSKYFKETDVYKNQYEYIVDYISESKEILLDISIKINEIQFSLYRFCVVA
jgi:hypothetical protein